MADAAGLFQAQLKPRPVTAQEFVDGLPDDTKKLFLDYAGDQNLPHAGMMRIVKQLEGHVSKASLIAWREDHDFPRC